MILVVAVEAIQSINGFPKQNETTATPIATTTSVGENPLKNFTHRSPKIPAGPWAKIYHCTKTSSKWTAYRYSSEAGLQEAQQREID